MSYVQCVGNEESLFDCYSRSSTDAESLYCYQSEPVGVKCLVENETGRVSAVSPVATSSMIVRPQGVYNFVSCVPGLVKRHVRICDSIHV